MAQGEDERLQPSGRSRRRLWRPGIL